MTFWDQKIQSIEAEEGLNTISQNYLSRHLQADFPGFLLRPPCGAGLRAFVIF